MGIETSSLSDLQYPLFKTSLHSSGEIPYLTLPQIAESYVANGLLGVMLYSMLYGALMMILYRISLTHWAFLIWYLAFFPFLSIDLSKSLLGNVIFPVKVLILITLWVLMLRLFPRTGTENKVSNHTTSRD